MGKKSECPFCLEDIKPDAVVCKHCKEKLQWSREEIVVSAVRARVRQLAEAPEVKPSVSAGGAMCHSLYARLKKKRKLEECLESVRLASAIAEIADQLLRELVVSFEDIIWERGDIDPKPFEISVRERFSGFKK